MELSYDGHFQPCTATPHSLANFKRHLRSVLRSVLKSRRRLFEIENDDDVAQVERIEDLANYNFAERWPTDVGIFWNTDRFEVRNENGQGYRVVDRARRIQGRFNCTLAPFCEKFERFGDRRAFFAHLRAVESATGILMCRSVRRERPPPVRAEVEVRRERDEQIDDLDDGDWSARLGQPKSSHFSDQLDYCTLDTI